MANVGGEVTSQSGDDAVRRPHAIERPHHATAESTRVGIVLAGGKGTRLLPTTAAVSKHLLPVYDKPMLHYALSTLLLAGLRDLVIVVHPRDRAAVRRLYGDGSRLGISIALVEQARANGIADGFLAAMAERPGRSSVMILGDNFFFGHGLQAQLAEALADEAGGTILTCRVKDPRSYGVLTLDARGNPLRIDEKPARPDSDLAITGLYVLDASAAEKGAVLQPSERGELEVTDLLRAYLAESRLRALPLGRGTFWTDMGTEARLLQAANFVQSIQARQGWRICCPEEIAFRKGFIDAAALRRLARRSPNPYGRYLAEVADGRPVDS
ncbi:MAG TPA: glucose-1-phosphate thymidylyltransferase [Planctomycetaceae bacterium]|nr:glucose-1-phosphate thymidylyltransferase [Planctomycetaceae bacterium]HRF00155.1 sugar phosphate nucleotidyltransferase [Pirellulaceae bacterium]